MFFILYEEHPGFQGATAEVKTTSLDRAKELLTKEFGRCPPDRNIKDFSDVLLPPISWPHAIAMKIDEVRVDRETLRYLEKQARSRASYRRAASANP